MNQDGAIVYVNNSWVEFGRKNNCACENWIGVNYFATFTSLKEPATCNDQSHLSILFDNLLQEKTDKVSYEYPCHSPDKCRWFLMTAKRVSYSPVHFVVSHTDITHRKLVETQVERISLYDSLTALANRRNFDQFFRVELHRNQRDKTPISVILFDIDHFKLINDLHGHLVGDECLKDVAAILSRYARRESDFAARWGGEEFVLLLGNTPLNDALEIAENIRTEVESTCNLKFGGCQLSAGVHSELPTFATSEKILLELADKALYAAKNSGRNKVCHSPATEVGIFSRYRA